MKALITNIIVVYTMLLLIAYFVSDYMIFLPPRAGYKNTTDFLRLTTSDSETIFALYLPNKNAKYTILVSHGNAEDIGYLLPFLQAMHDHGFAVFAYDYHGYGLSGGKPTERNAYLDINAAYDYLTKNLNIIPENIVVYGHSVGAAVALDLAVREPVAAVIMQGAFITAFRVMTYVPIIPFDKFDNLKKITQLKCPLLMIHGTVDGVIPFWHGRKLYNAAQVPKQFYQVKNAGHNDVLMAAGEEYWQVIGDFIKQELTTEGLQK
ncbi:MAG: Phospholipase/carboxylesterase superfamily [uncultured bacterium]|nr:MAG: Phospholipase/carboxylesterase superfamily [uncultured bacterium]